MAPNSNIIRYSPTPVFAARMLALPVLNDAVNRAIDVFDSSKTRNDGLGAALRAAEASMRVAASGALPLATPIVNTVGGWGVVDQWACRGLDQVEKVAPILKKPTKEIVTTTRQKVLTAVSGREGQVPDSFSDAITTRANQTADFMANTRGASVMLNAADQILASAHVMVDNYLPPMRGDRQGTGVPAGGVSIKVTSLLTKTQQRLYRSVYILIRPPTDRSLEGPITVALLLSYGQRTVENIYYEILREPAAGEPQNPVIAASRSMLKLSKNYSDQIRELLQKQLGSMQSMDRDTVIRVVQDAIQNSLTMTSNAGNLMQGGVKAVVNSMGSVFENAGKMRTYFEDTLRKAMSDYENRDRQARAAAAAESWRKKNNMERVASPPPEEYFARPATGAVNKSKGSVFQKKIIGRQ